MRILVVDDHRDSADCLALLLSERFRVSTAYDGASALAMLADARPDVVITDLTMPGMDGCELARSLRANPATAHTLLIALSGHSNDDRTERSVFDHMLRKPVDYRRLERLLDESSGDERETD